MDECELPPAFQKFICKRTGYYDCQRRENERLIFNCRLCPNKQITVFPTVTSNLMSHLKVKHPGEHVTFLEVIKSTKELKTPRKRLISSKGQQQTLDIYKVGETKASQENLRDLVAKFVVQTMSPMSIVSDVTFKELVTFLNSEAVLPGQKHLRETIISQHSAGRENLRKLLQNIDYVCITADCWSTLTHRFLGMTIHWLSKDFTRKSAALCLKRFPGKHTGNAIVTEISAVVRGMKIPVNKVTFCITDNYRNFLKAFKDYGIESDAIECAEDDEIEEDLSPNPIDEALSTLDLDEELVLPPHSPCVAHTLTLVAHQEPLKIGSKSLLHGAFGKCSALWTRSSSHKACESFVEIAGKAIIRPVVTRWNSKLDAINRVLDIKEHLSEICSNENLPQFRSNEIEFLEGYVLALEPICSSLDILQGENEVFMSDLLPELLNIIRKLTSDKIQNGKWSKMIADCLIDGIKQRFKSALSFGQEAYPYILASISNPFFKLRWVPAEHLASYKQLFIDKAIECSERAIEIEEVVNVVAVKRSKKEERFGYLPFGEDQDGQSTEQGRNEIQVECLKYFADKRTDLNVLHSFPIVKKLFRRYNSALPSSAPVERLFSCVGQTLTPKRNRMKDDLFEAIATLRSNQWI